MSAHKAIRDTVNTIVKDAKQAAQISDAVFTALDSSGWLTTDNDHLAMMRALLDRNYRMALDPETPAKDVSALTNRCQALSKEVATLEERVRQESRPKRGGTNTGTTGSQPLDI